MGRRNARTRCDRCAMRTRPTAAAKAMRSWLFGSNHAAQAIPPHAAAPVSAMVRRVNPATRAAGAAAARTNHGFSATHPPNSGPAPRPPRKRSGAGQMCPATTAGRASTCHGPDPGRARAIRTAAAALAASSKRTAAKACPPKTRAALVAPVPPLPESRRSVPVARRASHHPGDRQPSTYPTQRATKTMSVAETPS